MTKGDTPISSDLLRPKVTLFQEPIQQRPASRTFLPVHEANVFPSDVVDTANVLGIPLAKTSPCSHSAKVMTAIFCLGNSRWMSGRLKSADSESWRCEPAIWTLPSFNQVRARLLDAGRLNNLDAADSFDHAAQQARCGIAAGDDEALLTGFFFREKGQLCPLGRLSWLRNDAVRLRHVIGRWRNRNADPFGSDTAYSDGLPLRRICRTENVRLQSSRCVARRFWQDEQIFDGNLQFPSKLEGNLSIQNIRSGFDRVESFRDQHYPAFTSPLMTAGRIEVRHLRQFLTSDPRTADRVAGAPEASFARHATTVC